MSSDQCGEARGGGGLSRRPTIAANRAEEMMAAGCLQLWRVSVVAALRNKQQGLEEAARGGEGRERHSTTTTIAPWLGKQRRAMRTRIAREETASVGRPSRAIESATGSSTVAPVRGLARWAAGASASARAFRPLARLKSREAGAGANKNTRQTGIGRGHPCPAALLPIHARCTRVSVSVRGSARKKKELLPSCS